MRLKRKTGRPSTQPDHDFARLNVAAWWEDGPKDQDSVRNLMWFHKLPDPELDSLSAVSAQLSAVIRTEMPASGPDQ